MCQGPLEHYPPLSQYLWVIMATSNQLGASDYLIAELTSCTLLLIFNHGEIIRPSSPWTRSTYKLFTIDADAVIK